MQKYFCKSSLNLVKIVYRLCTFNQQKFAEFLPQKLSFTESL